MSNVVQLQFRSDGWPVPTLRDVAPKSHPVHLLEDLEADLEQLKEVCPRHVVSRLELALRKVDALHEAVANHDELVKENERLTLENETQDTEISELQDRVANYEGEVSDET